MDDRSPGLRISLFDPRMFVTVTLVVIQLSMWTAIALAGGGFFAVELRALIRFGALVPTLIHDQLEYWRLLSALFIHGALLHFLISALILLYFGGRVEGVLKRGRYVLLYFAAGLAGNLLAFAAGDPVAVTAGSSGAVFGVVVVYLMIETRVRGRWADVARLQPTRVLFFLTGFLLVMGFFLPHVDTLAHLGGAATGAVLGPLFLADDRLPHQRRRLIAAVWIGACAALLVFAARPPDDSRYHVHSAIYHLDYMGNQGWAFFHLHKAAARDPAGAVAALDSLYQPARGSAHVCRLKAELMQQARVADYEEALQACREGLKRFEGRYDWRLLEAKVHATFRHYEKALERLDTRMATTEPLRADHWETAALCHMRLRDWAQAEYATRRCLNASWLDPSGGEGRTLAVKEWRWQVLSELGRTSESAALLSDLEAAWRREVLRMPDHPVPTNNLAWFLATHDGDLKEAARLAADSVKVMPAAFNLDTLAWVEYRRGNRLEAWAAMERALDHPEGQEPELLYHAAVILEALDRHKEALANVEKALAPGVDFDDYEAAVRLRDRLKKPPK